ncbi:ribonuclease P protein component [Aerococcaceae bacterium DSM 111020]|nr:ribonuclease P protein component [Aerococcaceae bacterium DSM 111020]
MKKRYRIKKENEFQQVFHHGKSIANRQIVIYTYNKPNQEHFRVGLSVGKKIGNAVKRNQIKRYLRQAIHELEPAIQSDLDFLVIARKDIENKDFHQIKKSLIHVMSLAKVIDKQTLNKIL